MGRADRGEWRAPHGWAKCNHRWEGPFEQRANVPADFRVAPEHVIYDSRRNFSVLELLSIYVMVPPVGQIIGTEVMSQFPN